MKAFSVSGESLAQEASIYHAEEVQPCGDAAEWALLEAERAYER